MGTYIRQDPLGLDGGPNLYAYVHDVNSWVDPFGLEECINCIKNKREGLAREKKAQEKLEAMFGKGNVLRERTILDKHGKKVKGPDGTGRRTDFVILGNDGKAKYLVEVTSKTANKKYQSAKEAFIRDNGGDFIKKPGRKGDLIDISNAQSRTIRI